jgi:hypothetical protein
LIHRTAAFFKTEHSEEEKGLARSSANPIGIASAGIENLARIGFDTLIGNIDQLVFELKWTHLGHLQFGIPRGATRNPRHRNADRAMSEKVGNLRFVGTPMASLAAKSGF